MRILSFSGMQTRSHDAQQALQAINTRPVLRFRGDNLPDGLTEKPMVNIESPFSGKDLNERAKNIDYARACMRDSLKRGEAPWVMHLMYTQVLDDDKPEERDLGISAGLAVGLRADKSVACIDRGVSVGMAFGVLGAWQKGKTVEPRSIYNAPTPSEEELKAIVFIKYANIVREKFPALETSLRETADRHPNLREKYPNLLEGFSRVA